MIKQFVSIILGFLLLITVLPVMGESNENGFPLSGNEVMDSFQDPNSPPETPSTPLGPTAAGPGIQINFTTKAIDPDGDKVSYFWDWGDGNVTDWLGPFDANVSMTTNYTWYFDGTYSVRVKAKDIHGNESNWSAAHVISIAPQINVTNPKSGYIYLLVPAFNHSFFYSAIFDGLGVCVLLTTHELQIQANGTTAVKKVTFEVIDQKTGDVYQKNDMNASDGYSFSIDVFRGIFELSIYVFDGNNTLIDWYIIPFILFLRLNSGSSLIAKGLNTLGTHHLLQH
jgi:hypothetical protein